jgi:hypothetical protein
MAQLSYSDMIRIGDGAAMEIEFHYYMTYLIAARAGFSSHDAEVIAYSSQYVDENHEIYQIDSDQPTAYSNYITQTLNILKPKHELMRIYPIFHFIPGDPFAPTARRKDGKLHRLNTTPNSPNANQIMDDALSSHNLYRIGITSHSYVDTWAHQNFVGYYDAFNAMQGVLSSALPNIGHADAKHNPDYPALVWHDCRLVSSIAQIDNMQRFLEAAEHLFYKYRGYVDPSCSHDKTVQDAEKLKADLSNAIGEHDPNNQQRDRRIQRYQDLGETPAYGSKRIPTFDPWLWFDRAVESKVRGVSDRRHLLMGKLRPWRDQYSWKADYLSSDWYRFQEAAKQQQAAAWEILHDNTLHYLELENL